MNDLLISQVQGFLSSKDACISVLSNLSALFKESYPDLNWVGFYFYKDNNLYLGPFQGKVACSILPSGKGVCSKSLETNTILNIPNVHEFPSHIACDSASMSELVIPLYRNGIPYGVLDLDSPALNGFSLEMQDTFTKIGILIEEYLTSTTNLWL